MIVNNAFQLGAHGGADKGAEKGEAGGEGDCGNVSGAMAPGIQAGFTPNGLQANRNRNAAAHVPQRENGGETADRDPSQNVQVRRAQ